MVQDGAKQYFSFLSPEIYFGKDLHISVRMVILTIICRDFNYTPNTLF